MRKIVYRLLGLVASIVGSLAAGAAFSRVWKIVGGGDDPPDPKRPEGSWGEVLRAAALHGAIFGLVKAAVDRAGAASFARATGEWPG